MQRMPASSHSYNVCEDSPEQACVCVVRWIFIETLQQMGFPGGSAGKESTRHAGDLCSIPGFGKIPWRRERLPTPIFWPGESHGLSVHGVAKSRTQLSCFHLRQIHKSHDNSKIRQKVLAFYKAAGVLKVKSSPRSRMGWDLRGSQPAKWPPGDLLCTRFPVP